MQGARNVMSKKRNAKKGKRGMSSMEEKGQPSVKGPNNPRVKQSRKGPSSTQVSNSQGRDQSTRDKKSRRQGRVPRTQVRTFSTSQKKNVSEECHQCTEWSIEGSKDTFTTTKGLQTRMKARGGGISSKQKTEELDHAVAEYPRKCPRSQQTKLW